MDVCRPEPSFSDARGEITDLLEDEVINAVTLVTFRKGAVRGNHYHALTTQWNYLLSGRVRLVSQAPGAGVKEVTMVAGDQARTDALVRHAFFAEEESTLLVLTRGPRGGREYETDTHRLDTPLVPPSGNK